MKDEEKKNTSGLNKIEITIGISLTIFVFVLWFSSFFYIDALISYFNQATLPDENSSYLENLGLLGDKFGVINALFSGLAFAGIIFTIYLQKKELALQRHDLSLTRNELALTRIEFQQQNETLRVQRFENTFFTMLEFYLKQKDSFRYDELTGQEAINKFYNEINRIVVHDLGGVNNIVIHSFEDYHINFAEYFRPPTAISKKIDAKINEFKVLENNFYNLLNFVETQANSVPNFDKQFYIKLIVDSSTDFDYLLLLYLCIFELNDVHKVKLENYGITKKLRHNDIGICKIYDIFQT